MMYNLNRKGLKEKTAKVAKCLALCPLRNLCALVVKNLSFTWQISLKLF
jgi:hypothetical protein